MSRNTYDGSELQTVSILAAHPMHDEMSPLTPLMSDPSNGNMHSNQGASDFRARDSREQYGLSRNSSIQSSAASRKNSAKISYINEKEVNTEMNAFQGQKTDPVLFSAKNHYKESSLTYQPFHARRPDRIGQAGDTLPSTNVNSRLTNGTKVVVKGVSPGRVMDRTTQYHTFLADAADVRQIEDGLLKLMEEFQTGNLRAFGRDSRLRQMEEIREQQERLAKLHFDVGAEQDSYPPLSEDGVRISEQNMKTLMEKLADLSESIENLHTNSTERKTSTNERKANCTEKKNSQVNIANGHGERNNAFPLLNGDRGEHTRVANLNRPETVHEADTEIQMEPVVLRRT